MTVKRAILGALSGLAAVLALTGCEKTIDSGDLESQLADQLAPQLNTTVDQVSVDCPDDEKVEDGNEFDCTLDDEKSGQSVDVRVTLEGDDGKFSAVTVPKGG
jgi:uncharacterized protein DUF4333